MNTVEIRAFPIEMYKVLQIAGWLGSGGGAKAVIAEGQVTRNGEEELRKRCKCTMGDVIAFAGQEVTLVLEESE
ncbi:MAG: RNA-binding S4 domain-containing protein [Arenicella sp.]|jgi:ribosome-associated protein|nr:RNA-binding S4 domain-containing protein [Arenicella sp.]HAU67824.1 RNA-binding protein [Gammaproteobacteria bacterium]